MGNNSSHATTTKGAVPVTAPVKVEPFRPVVEVVKTNKINAHYGEHKLVKDKKTGQEYIQKEIVLNNKQTFDNEVNYIKNRINLKHDNVINVLGYDTEEKSGFCATHYKIIIYIEPLTRTLEQEITERNKKQQFFPEYELRSIAVSLINGLAFFQSKGFAHGDIRPSNIFVDERTKNVKLSDPTLHQTKGFNGLLAHIIRKEKSYLAPELLANVPKERLEFKGNANKADVYSLGMTLLSLATLTDSGDLYDYKHGRVQDELLQKRIESLNRNYPGGGLESIIRVMLNAKPEERADFVALSSQYGNDSHHHHTTTTHSYEVSHHHGEVEKRSAAPQHVHHVDDHSDLEARIKAALERSAQTFKSVNTSSTYTHTPIQHHEYTAPTSYHHEYTVPTTHHHEAVVSSIPATHNYEHVVSSIPATHNYEHVVSSIPTTHHNEHVVSSIPSTYHHHEYTAPTTYHHEYTAPTSYHHEYTVPTTHHHEQVVSSIPTTHHHEQVVSSVPTHHHETTVESHSTHHASGDDVVERALRSAMASSHLHTPTTHHQVETTQTHHHHVEPVTTHHHVEPTIVSATGSSNLRNSDFLRKSFLSSHIPSAHHTSTYTAPVTTHTTHHDHGEQVKRSTHIVDVPQSHHHAGGYTDVSYATYNPSSHYVSSVEHNVAPVSYTYTSYTANHAAPSTFTETIHDALHNVKQSTSVNEISNQ